MRILFLSNVFPSPVHPTKGVFNLGLVRALGELGHEVEVAAPIAWTDWLRAPRDRRQKLRIHKGKWSGVAANYPVYFYTPGVFRAAYGYFMWRGIRQTVNQIMGRLRPDAIVSYWAHPDGHCAIEAARQVGIPAVTMVGGSDILLLTANRARQQAIRRVLERADAVIAVSEDLRRRVIDSGVDASNVHVVRRGIDTGGFHTGSRVEARGRLGLTLDRPILLWVGRIEKVKGLPVLLAALDQLRREGVDCQTILVGTGERAAAVAAEAKSRGLSDLRLPGAVPHEQLADYYRAATMTVLPSLSEGVPNVLLESIACGTPFVASEVGGIPEIASPDIDRLVPPGDAPALAAAIRDQLTTPPAAANRTFVPDDWPKAAQRLIDVLEPLLPGHSTTRIEKPAECLKPLIV